MADLLARLHAALADRYTIERELGRGGMATVYLAQDRKHHRPVAIKVLKPAFAAALGPERFLREIETAARLNHPHILPLHDSGAADGFLYYVMPLVEGESLRGRLARETQLPVADALQITQDVADALSYAHSHDVVHRDIKPENILLSGGHAVVADFGIARAITAAGGDKLTETGVAVGTPAYMSPEQAAGERQLDGRTDVYSLACVVYEMLAGQPPFTGPTAQAISARRLRDPVPSLRTVRETAPVAVEQAIRKALAKVPADRYATASQFAAALTSRETEEGRPWAWAATHQLGRRIAQRSRLAAGVAGLAVVVAAVLVLRPRAAGPLDPDLVAVAPFNVLDPKLELWHEGLVDVLARSLDGAGTLRTVPASVAIKRSGPHADAAAAAELGRRTGAGLVVFGTLTSEGPDSVRLTAGVVDTRSGRAIGDMERRDRSDRMNRLTDSLSVALLRPLGGLRAGGVPRLRSVGTASLSALKAFLQGEQYFRHTAWDSALTYYGRAAALDDSFALAWRGMSTVLAWSRLRGDSLSLAYGRRAAGLNRGLAPRESLLITAESLSAALYTSSADTAWRTHQTRLFATLDEAAHRYPDDAEVWYELGEARFHFRLVGRTTIEQVLEAFDRAIALDSAFGVAYLHPIEIAFAVRGPAAVRRYIRAFLAHAPADQEAETQRLVESLLAHPEARPPDLERAIDSARTPILFDACLATSSWSDSLETAVRLARAVAASRRSGVGLFDDPAARKWLLSEALASRGHLREAYAIGGGDRLLLAVLGAVPPDSMAAQVNAWLANPPVRDLLKQAPPNPMPHGFNTALLSAPPWWAAHRDSVSLRRFAQRMESLAAGSREYADLKPWLVYAGTSTRAYLALVRRDSAEALRRFLALPDTICSCAFDQIVTARLLTAAGRPREPVAVFAGQIPPDGAALGLWRLERARAAERVGLRDKALADYEFVAALWRNADPELQPYVAEAKAALERFGRAIRF